MHRARQTQAGRPWRTPRPAGPTRATRPGRRAAPRPIPLAGGRSRRDVSRSRFGGMRPGGAAARRAAAAGRRKPSRGTSAMTLGRGLLGALGKQKRSQSKGSRKAPALLAVAAGLGAGAAALKRRHSGEEQPTADVPPVESAAPAAPAAAGPPGGAA
jgi:hypothetical protein